MLLASPDNSRVVALYHLDGLYQELIDVLEVMVRYAEDPVAKVDLLHRIAELNEFQDPRRLRPAGRRVSCRTSSPSTRASATMTATLSQIQPCWVTSSQVALSTMEAAAHHPVDRAVDAPADDRSAGLCELRDRRRRWRQRDRAEQPGIDGEDAPEERHSSEG